MNIAVKKNLCYGKTMKKAVPSPYAIPFTEALRLAETNVVSLPPERVLLHQALGRPVAEDVYCRIAIPPTRNSAMDGYALPDNGSNPAGYPAFHKPELFIGKSETNPALRVLTGQPVPQWAFCVAAEEHCILRESHIFPKAPFRPGTNIREEGEDADCDDILCKAGEILDPALLARLASAGYHRVSVSRRPRAVILTSGDELVRAPSKPRPDSPRFESDATLLAGLLAQDGIRFHLLEHQPDDPERILDALLGLPQCDILITCGGASNSEADHSRPVLERLGAVFLYERVAMKPGRPTAFGLLKGKPFFCLPGNPVAVFVSYLALVYPILKKMMGAGKRGNFVQVVEAGVDLPYDTRRNIFLRVKLDNGPRSLLATPYPDQGSGLIRSLVESDALISISPAQSIKAGSLVPLFWQRRIY